MRKGISTKSNLNKMLHISNSAILTHLK